MFEWLAGTIIGALIKSIMGAFSIRIEQRAHDAVVAEAAVARARAARDEQNLKTRKDMADAQVAAPDSRHAYAERLRIDADKAAHAAPAGG